MAWSPPKPRNDSPEEAARYAREMALREQEPHRWGLTREDMIQHVPPPVPAPVPALDDAEALTEAIPPVKPNAPDWDSMTKAELRQAALLRGITLDPTAKKADW